MKAIVNVSQNWGIGNNGGLLCSFKEDLLFFKEKTKGNIVVYGRKTLSTFPKGIPLKGRFNILLTHDKNTISREVKDSVNYYGSCMEVKERGAAISGFNLVKDPKDSSLTILLILQKAKLLEHVINILGRNNDTYIIGGESIYNQFLHLCDTVYVTKTSDTSIADAYFPNLDEDPEWEIAETSGKKVSEDKPDITYEFITYKRISRG